MNDKEEGNLILDVVDSFLRDDGSTLFSVFSNWIDRTDLVSSTAHKTYYKEQMQRYVNDNNHNMAFMLRYDRRDVLQEPPEQRPRQIWEKQMVMRIVNHYLELTNVIPTIKASQHISWDVRCNTIWDLLQTFLGEVVNWLDASDVVNTSSTRSCFYNTISTLMHTHLDGVCAAKVIPLRYITLSQLPDHWCRCNSESLQMKFRRGMNDRVVCMFFPQT